MLAKAKSLSKLDIKTTHKNFGGPSGCCYKNVSIQMIDQVEEGGKSELTKRKKIPGNINLEHTYRMEEKPAVFRKDVYLKSICNL